MARNHNENEGGKNYKEFYRKKSNMEDKEKCKDQTQDGRISWYKDLKVNKLVDEMKNLLQ